MFKKLFKKKQAPRDLTSPRDLRVGDILEFKPRSILPSDLHGVSLTVKKVQAYQYSDGFYPEFVLESANGSIVTMMCSPEEEEDSLQISKKLNKAEIDGLFNSAEIEQLWEEGAATVHVNKENALELNAWLADKYHQDITSATAYFFNKDVRGKESDLDESNSESLQYHECSSAQDIHCLTVEIWEDGSTDFYVQINLPFSVVAEMWPNAS
ncbi:MAG: hypothetical protein COC19_03945 [SAR86 cluster bacterium]|uniref:DUF4178 domain-containing protein n=1 Tax=SAR86 cluster bacterium TaxID=2030880 RepID=A0A2A4MPL5_9GAMM|nr:MAG: hypothetical protein COC19_03945 [SAR86 cluster bacterium]